MENSYMIQIVTAFYCCISSSLCRPLGGMGIALELIPLRVYGGRGPAGAVFRSVMLRPH